MVPRGTDIVQAAGNSPGRPAGRAPSLAGARLQARLRVAASTSIRSGTRTRRDDERRTIAEMMAKGTYGWILLATAGLNGTFEKVQAGGAEVVQEPTEQPDGIRDCAFRDPAGTWSASRSCAEPPGHRKPG